MRFGDWEIREQFEIEGGGFDALAVDDAGKEVRLWAGAPGSAAQGADAEELRKKLSTLYHASLPSVRSATVAEDRAVLVLQPYRGRPLAERLSSGPLAPTDAIDVVRAVGAALVKAHRAGVVHGAIGPDEIFQSEDGRSLLLHLGWGPFLAPRRARAPDDAGRPADAEGSDVFGLSRVLVQCLEGRDPLANGEDALRVFASGAPRDPATFSADLPEGLRRLLSRAMHPDASRRMRRAEELAGDLGVIRASWSTLDKELPHPTVPFPRLLHPVPIVGALALVLVLLWLAIRGCSA